MADVLIRDLDPDLKRWVTSWAERRGISQVEAFRRVLGEGVSSLRAVDRPDEADWDRLAHGLAPLADPEVEASMWD